MATLFATDKTLHTFGGITVVHEVHDGTHHFRHRLTCQDYPDGEWVGYEWFATITIDGRKFMACQDNWSGLFPGVFEVTEGRKHV